MPLDSLLEVIKKAQNRNPGFAARLAEAEALGRWEIAVGDLIAKHSNAIRVQDSVLFVEVDHPIWRSELHYRKQQILDILNGKTPCAKAYLTPPREVLKDIFYIDFRRGRYEPIYKPPSSRARAKEPRVRPHKRS